MKLHDLGIAGIAILLLAGGSTAGAAKNFNPEILETVDWLAAHRAGLGYSLQARYSEDLRYGNYTFKATGSTKTMCVAAVMEVIVRTLERHRIEQAEKPSVTEKLAGKNINGSTTLNLLPYVYQFKANIDFPEYGRKFSAGAGDGFVLLGIGKFVAFAEARPGDMIYFNRAKNGHAAIFIDYLASTGDTTNDPSQATGFRYFSAQERGTNGFGYRDAFFGPCPAASTRYVKDCGIRRSSNRSVLSVSRLDHPDDWFTGYPAIRVERFFVRRHTIEQILADEPSFRTRAKADLEAAERKAREAAKLGKFPLIVPAMQSEEIASRQKIKRAAFKQEFGPDFGEE